MKLFFAKLTAYLFPIAFLCGFGYAQHCEYRELQRKYAQDLQTKERVVQDNARLRLELAKKQQTTSPLKSDKVVLAVVNNNPMNVKAEFGGTKWRGQKGLDKFNHVIFESPEYGVRAAALTLRSYAKQHKIDTIDAVVNRFCTASKERKAKYASFISKRLGIGTKEKFNLIARMSDLLSAMAKFESGYELDPKIVAHYDILGKL